MPNALLGPGKFTTMKRRNIDVRDLKVSDIDPAEIGHALTRLCRFGGHIRPFWSVGAHSLLVAEIVRKRSVEGSDELVFAALMHDSPEAYIGDIMAPIKAMIAEESDVLERVEAKIARVIEKAFGLSEGILDHAVIKVADRDALLLEFLQIRKIKMGIIPGDLADLEILIPPSMDAVLSEFQIQFRPLSAKFRPIVAPGSMSDLIR